MLKPSYTAVDLHSVVQQAIEIMSFAAEHKNLKIEFKQ